nr:MAG TPA: hypothetical protein [Caudoviricetes sp.]
MGTGSKWGDLTNSSHNHLTINHLYHPNLTKHT